MSHQSHNDGVELARGIAWGVLIEIATALLIVGIAQWDWRGL